MARKVNTVEWVGMTLWIAGLVLLIGTVGFLLYTFPEVVGPVIGLLLFSGGLSYWILRGL